MSSPPMVRPREAERSRCCCKRRASLDPHVDYDIGAAATSIAIGDLDGDGEPDLAATSYDNTVSVLLGTGGGGFAAKTDYGTGHGPIAIAVGDVNGDTGPDLVTANSYGNTISVLLNRHPPITSVEGLRTARRLSLGVSPNPGSAAATFRFELPREMAARLEIFDAAGRRVTRVVDGTFESGLHRAIWRGRLDSGREAGPGLYYARLTTGLGTITRRFVWLAGR